MSIGVDGWKKTRGDVTELIESEGMGQRWSLKRRKTARSDAVPEIYGSPDNEGDSSASAMAPTGPFVFSARILGAQSPTWYCGEWEGEKPRAFNQFNYSLEPRMPKRDCVRRDVACATARNRNYCPSDLSLVAMLNLPRVDDSWKIEDKDLYLHRYKSRSRNVM